MEIGTPDLHPPASPAPAQPLAGKSLAELAELGRAHVRRLRGNAESSVLFGRVLAHARDAGLCREAELYRWIHREFGIERKQADKYLAASVLPPELVRDEVIDVDTLAEISKIWAPLWPVAVTAGRGVGAERMRKARRSVTACLATLGDLPGPERLERATAHLRGVLGGKVRLFRATAGERPLATPSEVGRAATRKIEGGLVHLDDLKARGLRGRALEGQWADQLWDALGRTLRSAAEALGRDPRDLIGRAWDRDGLSEKSRENETKPNENEPLGACKESAPEAPAQAEGEWYEPVVRAVVAHLTPEEVPWVADQLLLALTGRQPAPLLGHLRQVGARMHEVPETVREDLGYWLRGAAHAVLERRWPFLFDFFASAQLPGFRLDLHLLREVDMPPAILEVLERAWAYWPLPEDQLDLPEDADELWAESRRCEHALKRIAECYAYIMSLGGKANTAAMSAAWEAAVDLKQELLRFQRAFQPQ